MTGKHLIDMQLTEKCAVFGIFGPEHKQQTGLEAARLTFYGLWSLQHRGQESSGIASTDGDNIFRHAANGLVSTVYREEDIEQLPGHIAIGHNRYSTSGGPEECYNQPFVDHKRKFAFAHNGNLPDTSALEDFLNERHVSLKQMNDSAMMTAAIGVYLDEGQNLSQAIISAWSLFTGVFSALVMGTNRLIAFRDECGVRPLSLAKLDDGYCISSETCAFDTIGATMVRDIKPGELVEVSQSGIESTQVKKPNPRLDIFEMVYFARPDSLLNGKRVGLIRQEFGVEMAKEFPLEADVIVPVPESGIPAAQGYSMKTGIPFEMALIKNRYIHRTFIRPTSALRERDLKMKLNPVTELLKGQRVVLVDDSIVRGTTMRHLVQMVFEAGAKEVHLIITCPPVKYPDFYGINTPRQSELMAAYMTVDEIRDHVGATSLHFLSFDGMVRATGLQAGQLTTSCFNGDYPISIGKRVKEIKILKEGETLPKAGLHEVELANTSTR